MIVGLVACSGPKLAHAAPARELYTSPLFRGSLRLAEARCDVVYVVSGKLGLLDLDQVVEPYDFKLAGAARWAWARGVAKQLRAHHFLGCHAVILAGAVYAEPLVAELEAHRWTTEQPLFGLEIGQRLRFLRESAARAG